MALLLGCLLLHALLVQVLASPWWVPNLTLGGVVLAVGRTPRRWLLWSGIAALWMTVWAVRSPWVVFLGYLGCGWMVSRLSQAWDTTDPRLQGLIAGVASLFITGVELWMDQVWRAPVVGWAGVHVSMTALVISGLSLGQRRAGWRGRPSRAALINTIPRLSRRGIVS